MAVDEEIGVQIATTILIMTISEEITGAQTIVAHGTMEPAMVAVGTREEVCIYF